MLSHKEIVQVIHGKGCPGWWSQMIAVEFERSRKGRQKHEKADGFSVSITKVMPVGLSRLFAVATDPEMRPAWFPKRRVGGEFEDQRQILAGDMEEDRAAGSRLLCQGAWQGADRAAGEQARFRRRG
jgi:hypothetical protein